MEPMQDNIFDRAVKSKVDSFEPKVPDRLWVNISAQLNERNVAPLKKNKKFAWMKMAAAIVLLLIGATWYTHRSKEVIYLTANTKQQATAEEKQPVLAQNEPMRSASVMDRVVQPMNDEGEKNPSKTTVVQHPIEIPITEEMPTSVYRRPVIEEEVSQSALTPIYAGIALTDEIRASNLVQTAVLVQQRDQKKDKKKFEVSDVLNYLIGSMNQGKDKVVSFANDDEGSLKVAVDFKALKIKL